MQHAACAVQTDKAGVIERGYASHAVADASREKGLRDRAALGAGCVSRPSELMADIEIDISHHTGGRGVVSKVGISYANLDTKKATTCRFTQGRTAAPRRRPHTLTQGGSVRGKADVPITGADSARNAH